MRKTRLTTLLAGFALLVGLAPIMTTANAQVSGVTIDFAGAEPTTYDHSTGGGKWGAGEVNTDIERSLEGEDFACEDRVSYLTNVEVGNTAELRGYGAMTFEMDYSFTLDTTGQSGVALDEPVVVELTSGDAANNNDGGSSVTLLSSTKSGAIFTKGSLMNAKVKLTDVEAGETIILRTTVVINCLSGSSPTGNLQVKFETASMTFKNGATPVIPAEKLNAGARTVPFKSVDRISFPELSLSKTVTTQGATCPGIEELTITPDQTVRYCYVVTNISNSGGKLGANAYNITKVFDDSGNYPDFTVNWMSGLADIDGDGQVDDLAPGASAYTYYEVAFDGDKDTTLLNTAIVYGSDASTGGNEISATDTATIFIDAPDFVPSMTLNKLTNGSDSPTVLAGSEVIWTYLVSNTGNVPLADISVVDNKGVTVICPETSLAVAAQMTCTGYGIAIVGPYSNQGIASGLWETTTVTASDSSGYFGASPKISLLKSPDTQLVVQGETATFTISVENTGNVSLSNVNVSDPLAPLCIKSAATLTVGEKLNYSCAIASVMSPFTNTASVTAVWESVTVTSTDTASVLVDYLPKISVTKSASDTSIPESGKNVTFVVQVNNEGLDPFSLTSLIDDKFGNLDGVGTCDVPQVIPVAGSYSCSFVKLLKSETLTPHINEVTATGTDPESHPASAKDDARVNFTDVLPDIALTKIANPTAVKWTGDYVDYTLTVTNTSLESLVISTLVDNKFTLSAGCSALIGQALAPGASKQCTLQDQFVSGAAGGSFTNTATVVGVDNESNMDTATASATVNFWWYGRTPGYWKNHPEAWPTPYLPSNFIQDVFTVPGALLNAGNLDLDKNGSKDSLLAGLNYRGGSTLSGGAQILMRAAIAALLNEAYYGADFPIATSTSDFITQVNVVLSTQSRAQYVSFASYLDYWNNAVHASLP